ncbi:MAG TPA: hypothetical protein VMT75_08345 [Candidatus Saccharimonadales bacterium]|nr:hypothetical protein [Candidatus Saccharimonadales bacterium]
MFRRVSLSSLAVTLFAFAVFAQTPTSKTETIRGWISDEHCAGSKARDGVYAATNPECTKECVGKGYKAVLIDPKGKRVLVITDQEMAKKSLGDYVEVIGVVDAQASTIKPESIRFLEKVSWPPKPAAEGSNKP